MYKFILEYNTIKGIFYLAVCVYIKYVTESSVVFYRIYKNTEYITLL